jgi:ribosome-associated protein
MKKLDSQIQLEYIRASGPGGQNVNKVATAVQLRFDIFNSPSLASDIKRRLILLAGKRVNTSGVLILDSKRFRTQEQNRADALAKFYGLIQKASEKPKVEKKRRGEVKKLRGRAERE